MELCFSGVGSLPKNYSSFFSGTLIFEAVFFQGWEPSQDYSSFFSGTLIFEAVFFQVWEFSQVNNPFLLESCVFQSCWGWAANYVFFCQVGKSVRQKSGMFKKKKLPNNFREKITKTNPGTKKIWSLKKDFNPWKNIP